MRIKLKFLSKENCRIPFFKIWRISWRKSRGGSFLIEAMVALTLVIVGLLGLISLLNRSLSLNTSVQNRFIAAALAAEGIEVVKNIIDTTAASPSGRWGNGISSGNFCLQYDSTSLSSAGSSGCSQLKFDSSSGIYSQNSGGSGSDSVFTRIVSVSVNNVNNGIDYIAVSSTVRWGARGQSGSVSVADRFYNWRPRNP
jgi:Tfp pilus assembly protein PilV